MLKIKITNPENSEMRCETHGNYQAREKTILGISITSSQCPRCSAERNHAEDVQRRKLNQSRALNRRQTRRTAAGISKRNLNKTFNDYKITNEGQRRALSVCFDYSEAFPEVGNLLLLGSCGTGKTLLASLIVDSIIDKFECKIIQAAEIFRDIKETFNQNSKISEKQIIDKLVHIPLLIIDEVGVQESESLRVILLSIIDGRYNEMLPTIIVSNLDSKSLEKRIGLAFLDRLRDGGSEAIAFDWESMRG